MDRAYSTPGSTVTPSSASTVSSIIPSARDALKEGARLIAAGLNDLATVEQGSPGSSAPSVISPIVAPMSGYATISRASIASSATMQKASPRHETTQSMSSVSTATSSTRTSTTQSSQRLSQSSASSVLSLLSLDDPIEDSSPVDTLLEEPMVSVASSPIQPARAEKLLRRRSQDTNQSLTRSPLSPSPLSSEVNKKLESTSSPKGKVKARPASMALGSPTLPTPVSTWMGSVGSSVGRKWEEMQKNDACVVAFRSCLLICNALNALHISRFTKSQKRASLLISDVSQSFFAALSSPTPSAGPSPMLKPSPLSTGPSLSPSPSLLDDEPEQMDGQTLTLGAPLIPSVVSSSPSPTPSQKVDDEEEEWNW
jgi:hypothetical protein